MSIKYKIYAVNKLLKFFFSKRYEAPDNKNRWDSPLFPVFPEDELNLEDIFNALFQVKTPKPNLSTQCVSLK